jgi:hypothetical protein
MFVILFLIFLNSSIEMRVGGEGAFLHLRVGKPQMPKRIVMLSPYHTVVRVKCEQESMKGSLK